MNILTPPEAQAANTISRALLPDLVISKGDLPAAVIAAAKLLARGGRIFQMHGILVHLIEEPGEPPRVEPLSHHAVIMKIHELCRPVLVGKGGETSDATFPEQAARMLVDTAQGFLPLSGMTRAPILADDGGIRTAQGYDPASRLWCSNTPAVNVPARPTKTDAEAALLKLRAAFETFPFADSPRITSNDLDVVDTTQPPGDAESAFICSLFTAICRASLWLVPGIIITAPDVSGAGSGKGLLVQAICATAFGSPPAAFTAGSDKAELDKRLVATLMQAAPAVMIDNVNNTALKSDTLASVITERPTAARVFGLTKMVPLNSAAFIAVTGNGLSVSEDLARRFLACELDPKCDDPEARDFPTGRDGFLDGIKARRGELLSAALTIWRWGRQNQAALKKGKAFGSFETWAAWVRDPLLDLGCTDPVEGIARAKARDPRRQRIAEFFAAWWHHHRSAPMRASELAEPVRAIADPQDKGRQYLTTFIGNLAGTRAAEFVMTRQEAEGQWSAASYQLKAVEQTQK